MKISPKAKSGTDSTTFMSATWFSALPVGEGGCFSTVVPCDIINQVDPDDSVAFSSRCRIVNYRDKQQIITVIQ